MSAGLETVTPFPSHARIVGGVQATKGEFPFIVSLQSASGSHFCGGSLIRKNWVLTAAHCVEGGYLKSVVVGLHTQGVNAGTEKFTVLQIIKHPKWNSQSMYNDYALVKLSGDSTFAPVALNTKELSGNVDFVTAGWGATSESSQSISNLLMKVSVPLVSREICSAAYPNSINESMICAGYPKGGKDSCQGDSGGPLVTGAGADTTLAGVVSWGVGCARPNKYGVYSKVNAALTWINNTAK
ncbi:MAG TPA: trypsin [Elusimicrobia bacterium]|nr:trypsin [Elusimicrobiota bacterium]